MSSNRIITQIKWSKSNSQPSQNDNLRCYNGEFNKNRKVSLKMLRERSHQGNVRGTLIQPNISQRFSKGSHITNVRRTFSKPNMLNEN